MRGKGSVLIKIGIFLVACAILLAAYNIVTGILAARASQNIENQMEISDDDFPLIDPDMEMPVVTIDGIDYIGKIEIPSVDINLPVASKWSYDVLKVAPGRYSGSAYKDDMVIAAHNYRNHFGRLVGVNPGDTVKFTDVKNHVFEYEITDIEIIDPYDVKEMTEKGDWDLTLFTCTLGGRTRLTIRCERTSEDYFR